MVHASGLQNLTEFQPQFIPQKNKMQRKKK